MSAIKGVGSGAMNLMDENPELRWSFIRKVYSIVTVQLLLTIAVVSVVVFFPPVANFFNNYVPYYVHGIVALFALCSAELYYQTHLLSYFFVLIFNVSFALLIGLLCALIIGKMLPEALDPVIAILVAAILTTTAVIFSATLYTFSATKRGRNFNFLYRLRFGALLVIILSIHFQMLDLLGKLSCIIISGCLLFIIFCGSIVINTDNLIKRISYAKYISASISLYLDVINLFLSLSIIYPSLLYLM